MSQEFDDDKTRILTPQPDAGGAGAPHYALRSGTRLSEFEIISTIGEGGFGIVYLAWDGSLKRQVALKEYMPSSLAGRVGPAQVSVLSERHRDTFDLGLRSFVNEAQMLARFDHPSLVKVYRFWVANGTAYMAMPFYKGTTLKAFLKQSSTPPTQQWLMSLLDPLTSALMVLHRDQVYHRDIAPDNILLLEDPDRPTPAPLLLDFGAARRVIAEATHAPTVILKSGYAPLEQYGDGTDATPQGPWTDIYALGATIHHAIRGMTPQAAVHRVVSDKYKSLASTPPPGFDARFLTAIDQALRLHAAQRPQTMAEFRRLLGFGEQQGTVRSPPGPGPGPGTVPVPAPPSQPSPQTPFDVRKLAKWVVGGIVAVLVAMVGLLVTRAPVNPKVEPSGGSTSEPLRAPSQPNRAASTPDQPASVNALPSSEPAASVSAAPVHEPRVTEPKGPRPVASRASAGGNMSEHERAEAARKKAECDRLTMRMSTGGESTQDLLERFKALGCR